MSGGGGEKTVTRNVNEPFAEQKPFLTDLYSRASKLSRTPTHYYPWDTVTARNPYTQMGIDQQAATAQERSPYVEGVGDLAEATFRGDFLDPESNPYLRGTYDMAARAATENYQRAVMPGIASRYGGAGRVGSPEQLRAEGIAQDELSTNLGDLASTIYGGAYERERGLQTAMAQMAPALEEARFSGSDRLMQSGLMNEDYAQRVLDDWVGRYEYERDEPAARLERLAGILGSPVTGSGTQVTKGGGGGNMMTQGLLTAIALSRMR